MSEGDAKSGDELAAEIGEDLFNEGVQQIASMRFNVVLSSDWRGSFGWLLPAVQVFTSAVKNDATEDEQNQMQGVGTAGLVKEYSLVKRKPVGNRLQ
jgi:hypothetical protein